ncbi:MAG TPA: hypothetical protein VI789_04975 [Dehalococcoidia bacterium]|nr:hypothetical protein [Dehalococcoidia bacterium]
MGWLRWLVIALALAEAGWIAFDGMRALIAGDYVEPRSGPYAGQLGLWARLVSAVGVEPRSTLMKAVFAVYGLAWLVITAAFREPGPLCSWPRRERCGSCRSERC